MVHAPFEPNPSTPSRFPRKVQSTARTQIRVREAAVIQGRFFGQCAKYTSEILSAAKRLLIELTCPLFSFTR